MQPKKHLGGIKRRLASYLAAATTGALGFGTPSVAEADIVFTPGPFNTGVGGSVDINFDGLGLPEFTIDHTPRFSMFFPFPPFFTYFPPKLELLQRGGAMDHMHVEGLGHDADDPAALPAGFQVGPAATFGNENDAELGGTTNSFGNFKGANSRAFLGVKFDIGGNTFFGWVDLEVNPSGWTGTVHGYAYDDMGQPILTGDTGAPQVIPEPHSLVLLALGAAGLAAMRARRRVRASA
ncbi:MAG: PEP-CTERM sorting domain-containing protein [Gemmataceae bacterium]|nr:PEP-CTERM sorting domain-containing protein [Gemmataceae bacterium]